MMSVTLNPGFVPILAALLVLAAPRALRAPTMAGAAMLALWLLLDHEFGAAAAMAQAGVAVVLLDLDALNRIFGIALLIALLITAIYSSARRNRYEDSAILMLAGGAVSALFVGDLVSFVAATSLAGLAAAWVVFCSTEAGANRAGARLLIWYGLEGLLFLVGVAFHISAGAAGSVFARLDVGTISGGFLFAALMIRVGAPFAHVWLKDAVSHASPAGAAALSIFTTMLGVYALARLFPAEPLLTYVGAAMIAVGLFYAAAEDDLRRAGVYALMAQTGVCVTLIGIGSPLALAAAEGHAFASIFAFAAVQMVFGVVLERTGSASIARLDGLSAVMPITGLLLLGCGLAAASAPGFALYATHAVALEAASPWELRWIWALFMAVPPVLFVSLALRPTLAAYRASATPRRTKAPAFAMLLGAAVVSFFCLSIGLAPQWLYSLMPAELAFRPFALDRLAPHLELLGAGGAAYLLLRAARLLPREREGALLDMDALYRGPIASGARWGGVLMLRTYGAWQAGASRLAAYAVAATGRWAQRCDAPYANRLAGVIQWSAVAGIVLILLFAQ